MMIPFAGAMNPALLFLLATFLLIVAVRCLPVTKSLNMHLLFVQTALGFAIALLDAGWMRVVGFALGIYSIIECARRFSDWHPESDWAAETGAKSQSEGSVDPIDLKSSTASRRTSG
jgi:hypothetical protein